MSTFYDVVSFWQTMLEGDEGKHRRTLAGKFTKPADLGGAKSGK
jgi:hypothetical protein